MDLSGSRTFNPSGLAGLDSLFGDAATTLHGFCQTAWARPPVRLQALDKFRSLPHPQASAPMPVHLHINIRLAGTFRSARTKARDPRSSRSCPSQPPGRAPRIGSRLGSSSRRGIRVRRPPARGAGRTGLSGRRCVPTDTPRKGSTTRSTSSTGAAWCDTSEIRQSLSPLVPSGS